MSGMEGESSLMRMDRLKSRCATEVFKRCMTRYTMSRKAGQLKEQEYLEETMDRTFSMEPSQDLIHGNLISL